MNAVSSPEAPLTSTRATAVAHAWLREPLYEELRFQANRRREHIDAFTAKIVTAAILLGVADEIVAKAEELLQIR